MPEWVFFNIPHHYLMTPIFTFGRKACHRMPASIHLWYQMVYQRILLPLAALTMFCLRRKNQLCQLCSANHNSLCPTPYPCSLLLGCVSRCPWSSDCHHLLHADITLPQVQVALPSCFLTQAYLVPLSPHCSWKSRKLSPEGIPLPFGYRSQWDGKYPCLLEQFKRHSRCFQGGPSRIKLPLPIAMTWFMCP